MASENPSKGQPVALSAQPAPIPSKREPPHSQHSPRVQIAPARNWRDDIWIYLFLFAATWIVYDQVRQFDFLSLDDPQDVSYNPQIRAGLSPQGIGWAFTSGENALWHPLTRLSHMLDCDLFGLQGGKHHQTNLFFHAAATLLLFAFLARATRARWPSAFVAFLFALHPLHVESVAWVTERKDVLSATFWFLTLLLYVRYTERPKFGRYLIVLLSFALALLSKAMTVTLPFVLLLVDFWPLRRLSWTPLTARPTRLDRAPIPWKQLLREKLPFFALSAVASVITYLVAQTGGAVKGLSMYSPVLRFENILVSYLIYAAKTFWPDNLAIWYTFPQSLPIWQVLLAAVLILGVSVIAWLSLRTRPYLAVGWLWYLGTLVPVIGLIQSGMQSRADRFMYIPLVGLSIIVAWSAADVVQRWPRAKPVVAVLAAAACVACVVVTIAQLQYWKSDEALFQHAVRVTNANYLAYNSLGTYLSSVPGRTDDAVKDLDEAVRIKPDYAEAHARLGLVLADLPGRLPDAVRHLETALRLEPDVELLHYNLGLDLAKTPGRLPDAIQQFQEALRINPNYAEAHNDLGLALLRTPGRYPEAITQLETAIRLKPDYDTARNNLAAAHNNIAAALLKVPGRTEEAIQHFEAALQVKPDYAELHYNLGAILANIPGRLPEAIRHLEAAQRLKPDADTQQLLQRLRAAQAAK